MAVKNVLITGVSGFIGQALVHAFESDPEIRLFGHSRDAAQSAHLFGDKKITMVEGTTVADLDDHSIHTVVHLAGIAHDLSNRYRNQDYYTVNDMGTRKLYDAFRESGATNFIFLSSIKAAVDTSSIPADESIEPAPSSAYGKSKLQAE